MSATGRPTPPTTRNSLRKWGFRPRSSTDGIFNDYGGNGTDDDNGIDYASSDPEMCFQKLSFAEALGRNQFFTTTTSSSLDDDNGNFNDYVKDYDGNDIDDVVSDPELRVQHPFPQGAHGDNRFYGGYDILDTMLLMSNSASPPITDRYRPKFPKLGLQVPECCALQYQQDNRFRQEEVPEIMRLETIKYNNRVASG